MAESGFAPPTVDRNALLAATTAAAGARTWAVCDPPTRTLAVASVCLSPQPPHTPIDCPWGVSRVSKYDSECSGLLDLPVALAQTVDPSCTAYIPKTYEYSTAAPPPGGGGDGGGGGSDGSVSAESEDGGSSVPVGAIVGGVIGGLALVALAVAGILFWRQRKTTAGAQVTHSQRQSQPLPQQWSMPASAPAPAGLAVVPDSSYATSPPESVSVGGWTSNGTAPAPSFNATPSTTATNSLLPYLASVGAAQPAGGLVAWQLPYEDIVIERPAPGYSMGSVFKAVWNHTVVAVQVVEGATAEVSSVGGAATEVEAVAELMAGLHHPNIIQFLGYCTWPCCLVTEYVERGSLGAVLAAAAADPRRAAELSWDRRMGVAWGSCRALLFCHTRPAPITHRAVSSLTLLIGADWTPKLAGFDHAHVAGGGDGWKDVVANPRWLSPQALDGAAPAPADDVYSFGVVLWELLTWQFPWGDAAPWTVVAAIQGGRRPAVPPAAQLPGLGPGAMPPGLGRYVALMERCWAQQPQNRPSFEDIMAEMRAIHPGLE